MSFFVMPYMRLFVSEFAILLRSGKIYPVSPEDELIDESEECHADHSCAWEYGRHQRESNEAGITEDEAELKYASPVPLESQCSG